MDWRTDFENMPKDGSEFLAWVKYNDTEGGTCAELVYLHCCKIYKHTVGFVDGESFWYTPHAMAIDEECGDIGYSRLRDEQFIAWCPITPPKTWSNSDIHDKITPEQYDAVPDDFKTE